MKTNVLEDSIICACIADDTPDELFASLQPDDFSDHYAPIFHIARDMYLSGEERDFVRIAEILEHEGREGIMEFLRDMAECMPYRKSLFQRYIADLKEFSLRKKVHEIGICAQRWGIDLNGHEAYQRLYSAISGVSVTEESTLKKTRETIDEYLRVFEHRLDNSGEIDGLTTGLKDLDARFNGLKPGWLIIVAGRPSMGKTTLALNMIRANALNNVPCIVFSMEMSHEEITGKLVADIGGIACSRLADASLTDAEWPKITAATHLLRDIPLYIDDRGSLSTADIRAKAYQVKRLEGALGLIMVDYLQLMNGSGDNRTDSITRISRELKIIAKDLGVPVVVIAQPIP